jgi:hypothetical protein
MKPIIEIVRERVGRRNKITSAEMDSILRAIHAEYGKDSLANGYVPRSFDEVSNRPWLAWMALLRGITVVSFGQALRDGWMRYDQPGSMNPSQHAALSFVREGGVSEGTIPYLREHSDRLLIVADDEQEVFLPPGLQRRLFEIDRRGPYRLAAADAAAVEMLWDERNKCDDMQVDGIDERMLKLVVGDKHVPHVYRLECDNGHKWESADADGAGATCPKCGQHWV